MPDVQIDSGNVKFIMILLCVVGLGVYVFLEMRKIKQTLTAVTTQLESLKTRKQTPTPMNPSPSFPKVNHIIQETETKTTHVPHVPNVPEVREEVREDVREDVPEVRQDVPEVREEVREQVREEVREEVPEVREQVKEGLDVDLNAIGDMIHPFDAEQGLDLEMDLGMETDGVNDIQIDISELDKLMKSDDHKEVNEVPSYENMSVNELKEILKDKGLPTSGNKTKMIEKIMNSA